MQKPLVHPTCMASRVSFPITMSKSASVGSIFGSCAARSARYATNACIPGAIAPPAYLPFASTKSMVTAVPISTEMYGGSKNNAAPTAPAILSCPSCSGFLMSINIGEFSWVRRMTFPPKILAACANFSEYAGTTEHHDNPQTSNFSNGRVWTKISAKSRLGKSELSRTR